MKYSTASVNRGIALVQVLILAAILFSIVYAINADVKKHLVLAQRVQTKSALQLKQYSEQNKLLFSMLSKSWIQQAEADSAYQQAWNFYGSPFVVDGVGITIQDMAGLLYIGKVSKPYIKRLAAHLWQDEQIGNTLAAVIEDWQDTDDNRQPFGAESSDYPPGKTARNSAMQFEQELLQLKGVNQQLYSDIEDLITLYPIAAVNVMNIPDTLLYAFFNPDVASQLVQFRQNSGLSREIVRALTGVTEDDFFSYLTGPAFRIGFTVSEAETTLQHEIVVKLDPYGAEPLTYWQSKRLQNK